MGEQVQLVQTCVGFFALQDEWNALAKGASPTMQFDWLTASEELETMKALRVVTVRREGVLVAATVLVEPREAEPRLELLGQHFSDEAAGVLAQDEAALATLLRALTRLRRLQRRCWPLPQAQASPRF